MTQDKTDKSRLFILSFYGLCCMNAALGLVPLMAAQNISLTAIFVILILAYIRRSMTEIDSLENHHLTYLIRSIWIYSLFAAIGITGAGWMIWENGNNAAIDTLTSSILGGAVPTEADMDQTTRAYLADNESLISKAMVTWLFPSMLYFVWRIGRGMARALKNYRVQNIYSWL